MRASGQSLYHSFVPTVSSYKIHQFKNPNLHSLRASPCLCKAGDAFFFAQSFHIDQSYTVKA